MLRDIHRKYERFLRIEQLESPGDILKARAVYITALAFVVIQLVNLYFMTVSYGGITADHYISMAAVLIMVVSAQFLRWSRNYTSFALYYSLFIFAGIALSALPDQTGINSSLLPMLIAGVVLNGLISTWRWILIYSICSVAFIWILWLSSTAGLPATMDATDMATRNFQRAVQGSLSVVLIAAIVALFNINLESLFQRLAREVDTAQRAEAAKSQFLANMSHELRTPLNGVIGMSQLLSRTDLDETQSRYVDIVNGCSRGLIAIVNDVLDLAKLDAGKVVLQREPFDLKAMLDALIDLHRPTAIGKGLHLAIAYPPDAPTRFISDESRLRQVVNNLIGNAIKFTSSGSVGVHIRCREIDERTVALSIYVQDTGVGIPPEHQQRVFARFEQIDATSTTTTQGTGLGLSISRDLVRLLGGELTLASEPGVGTTFAFAIPLTRDRRAQTDRSATQPVSKPSSKPSRAA